MGARHGDHLIFFLFAKTFAKQAIERVGQQPRHEFTALFIVKRNTANVHFVKTRRHFNDIRTIGLIDDFKITLAQVVAKIDFEFKNHRHFFTRIQPTEPFFAKVAPVMVKLGDDFFGHGFEYREFANRFEFFNARMNLHLLG